MDEQASKAGLERTESSPKSRIRILALISRNNTI